MISLLVAMAAPVEAAAIRLPLDRPLVLTNEETRDDGRSRRRYRVERRIVFAAEPTGYRATVTLIRADAEARDTRASAFRAANRPLLGQEIVVHLDADGRLLGVDDLDLVWSRWLDALRASAATDAPRAASAQAATAGLDRLPPVRRAAIVAEPVTAAIAAEEDAAARGRRPVQLTVGAVTLAGFADAVATGGRTVVRTRAEGSAPGAEVRVALEEVREIDPASRLVLQSRRTVERRTRTRLLTTVSTTMINFR